jgi:hypothetical protein
MSSGQHLGMKSHPRIQTPRGQQDEYLCRTESDGGVARLYGAAQHVEQTGLFFLSDSYICGVCVISYLILTDMLSIFNTASHF